MSDAAPPPAPRGTSWKFTLGYGLMLVSTVAGFCLIRAWGETQPAAASPAPAGHVLSTASAIYQVLLALVVIVATCRSVGWIFERIGQPRVIGEVVAGILLGPSVLGMVAPQVLSDLVSPATDSILKVIAQLGVILYMFLVGLELNAELLYARARITLAIAHASMAVPFLLGAALALPLFTSFAPGGVSFTSFALFLGIALAVTALPVLARILTDRGLEKTPLGVLSLGCAAVGDVTAWCLLALVVGIVRSALSSALVTALLTLAYLTVMFLVVAPLARRMVGGRSEAALTTGVVAWILVALLFSAWTTEAIGIHALFGAFLLGAIIPHESAAARLFTHKLEDVVVILLLPVFFAHTGLRTQIGLVSSPGDWLVLGVIILAATAGKFGGTFVAGRVLGLDWHTSAALGALMNTRGLMELIVLNIGLEMGVISSSLFAMLVLMALVTTLMTGPLLQLLSVRAPALEKAGR